MTFTELEADGRIYETSWRSIHEKYESEIHSTTRKRGMPYITLALGLLGALTLLPPVVSTIQDRLAQISTATTQRSFSPSFDSLPRDEGGHLKDLLYEWHNAGQDEKSSKPR